MLFTRLTFLAAFFIEGLASLVSIIGISSLFGNNLIVMSLMGALDVGKILIVSLLYTYWSKLPKLMKAYALIAATITMVITSAGAAGYLSSAFQQAIIGTQEGALQVATLKEQQTKYEDRKKQIDDQIANLDSTTSVNQRLRLMNGFKQEQARLDAQILEIDKQLPALQISQIKTEAKAGPILFIAKAFDISVENAIKWVILLIVFVFDPLAIFLVISGNFLYAQYRQNKQEIEPVPKAEIIDEPITPAVPNEVTPPEEFKLVDAAELAPEPIAEPIELKLEPIEPVKVKRPRKPRAKKQKPTEEVADQVAELRDLSPEVIVAAEEVKPEIVPVIEETPVPVQIEPPVVEKVDVAEQVEVQLVDVVTEQEPIQQSDLAKAVWGNIPKTPRKEVKQAKINLPPPRRRQNL